MDIKAQFPGGELSINGQQFMVRDGAYFWPVADLVAGEWVLNARGQAATGVAAPKKTAPRPKVRMPETLDELDLDS